MSIIAHLKLIQDELDSIQCFVKLRFVHKTGEVEIEASNLADKFIAKRELTKRGFIPAKT